MHQIYNLVFVVFLVENLQFIKSQSCPERVYTINKIKVTWPSSNSPLPVSSNPLCVNKHNILVKRTCVNGEWLPKTPPDCVSVQVPFHPECRSGDSKIKKTGSLTDYCVYISKPQHWKAKLPVVEVEDVRGFLDNLNLTNSTIWLPINRTEKYGKFIWRTQKYKTFKISKLIKNKTNYKPDFARYDCMTCHIVTNANGTVGCDYLPEDCKANHQTVHIYEPKNRYIVQLKNMIYSTMNTNSYFLGEKCQKLAQPATKEDNFAIKTLVANRTCRIGVERDIDGFKWQNSNKFINYTDWISTTNFTNSIVVINKDGWYLENNNNINECSVCEIDYTTYKTELIVQRDKNHSNFIITTYSYQRMKYLVAHTFGLADIIMRVNYTQVENEDTNIQDDNNKLDIRRVWIVKINNIKSNYLYFTALVLPEGEEMITKEKFFSNNNTELEYAFVLKIETLCNSTKFICDPQMTNFYTNISKFLLSQVNNLSFNVTTKLSHIVNVTGFRPIKILKIKDDGDIKMLYHLRTNGTLENIAEEYKRVELLLKVLDKEKLYYLHHKLSIEVDSLKSCMGCLPESKTYGNRRVMWEFTEIGKYNTPLKNCLHDDVVFTRKCDGNYLYGAEWNKPEKNVYNTDQHSNTEEFCNLYQNRLNITQLEVFQNLSELTTRNLAALDILYVSKIMQNAPYSEILDNEKKSIAETFSLIINNMIAANISSLKTANYASNSTNAILATAEKRLQELTENDLDSQGVNQLVHNNYMFRTADPFVSGITGLALISPSDVDNPSLSNYTIRDITANMTIEEIISWENLETAIYVPETLLDDIRNHSNTHNTTVRISISIYFNDSLFIENKVNDTDKSLVASRVYDVTIKGYENYLFSALPVITKLKVNSTETLCAYWDFGSPENNITYGWRKEYKSDIVFLKNNTIQICNFTHLTNFAMLLGKQAEHDFTAEENRNLEIITAVGCLFSTIGICGIFLTALVFKSWRQKVGSKVLLNVSACILLQIVLLYLNMKYTETVCIITGTLLHYSILCGFSWSLIMAVLQYLRFVRVMGGPTAHLLLKSSVVGWFLPVIPVTIALVVNQVNNNKYIADLKDLGSNICYPQGLMLYLTLLVPVTLIILANLVIFFLILYNISWKSGIRKTLKDNQVRIQQLKLAILLFFLLGLTWIVGLVSVMYNSVVFLYFFCATATIQGFVLFLFYIVLDQSTRGLWYKMLKSKAKSTKKMSQSQQTTIPTAESNTYNSTKEESASTLTEVANWNTRAQAVMQELEGTYRVGSDVRSKHQVMS